MKTSSSGLRLRAKSREAKKRREWLVASVHAHLLPAFTKQGFVVAPLQELNEPMNRDYSSCFPHWERLMRHRESVVDLVEIQFASHGRAGFRISLGVASRDGMTTWAGQLAPEQMSVHFLEEWFESDARPWMRKLNLPPFGSWFSVWHWPWHAPNRKNFEDTVLQAAEILPEIEAALREGKSGPHLRKVVLRWSSRPRPREVQT
jgi:hypothetical protein